MKPLQPEFTGKKKTNKHRSILELQFQCIDKWVTDCGPGHIAGEGSRNEGNGWGVLWGNWAEDNKMKWGLSHSGN